MPTWPAIKETENSEDNSRKQVMLTLNREDYDELKSLAEEEDRSVASYIRRMIKKALAARTEEE